MKMVKIGVIAKPKSFADVKFTEAEYKAAQKDGSKTVPYVTAVEAVKNSKGLYELKADPVASAEIPAMPDPAEMTSEQLYAELASHGKAPRKQMKRADAEAFILKLRAEGIAMIGDDE